MPDLDLVVLGGGGHVGLPLSLAFARAGLRVGIFDTMLTPERAFGGRRILVAGGAGPVGGVLTPRPVEAGARVTVLDDLFTGRAETIPTGAQPVQVSVTDQAPVRGLVGEHPFVFYMAACNIVASTQSPHDDFETNIGGTLSVLRGIEAAAKWFVDDGFARVGSRG